MDYLDYCFDCHNIDKFEKIEDQSIDIVILTNVVHHLYDPVSFFKALTKKLARDALIICTEPYPSIFSLIMYKLFHSEPMIFSVKEPKLNNFEGPLSSSNQAIPYLIFIKEKEWSIELRKYYTWDKDSISYYTFISYFITGGISRKFYIPHFIYKIFFHLDYWLASLFPKVFASFFEICLKYRGKDS